MNFRGRGPAPPPHGRTVATLADVRGGCGGGTMEWLSAENLVAVGTAILVCAARRLTAGSGGTAGRVATTAGATKAARP